MKLTDFFPQKRHVLLDVRGNDRVQRYIRLHYYAETGRP